MVSTTITGVTKGRLSYLWIIPNKTIKIRYSKRIERPDYGALNPFVNTTDPKNITAGNPYFLPKPGMRYELTYNHDFGSFGSFMATLFYRINKNDIQPYVAFYPSLQVGDSTYTNVSISTRENIGIPFFYYLQPCCAQAILA